MISLIFLSLYLAFGWRPAKAFQVTRFTCIPSLSAHTSMPKRYDTSSGNCKPCFHGLMMAALRDLSFVGFGSTNVTGVSYGGDDDEVANWIDETERRREQVEMLMNESNRDFREKRRLQKRGKFANVTNAKELEEILEHQKLAIDKANREKAALAANAGVIYEVLAPKEPTTLESEDRNQRSAIGLERAGKSWLSGMDDDLWLESAALTAGDVTSKEEEEWGNDDREDSLSGDFGATAVDDVAVDERTGTLVARDELCGVRVGSAGGWSLEVFPGDYVVHRKYGIGKFVNSCLRPKNKLTPEEQKAQNQRREELLAEQLRKMKRVTPDDIQRLRANFGTEEDTDPVSNPKQLVLEISYADVTVHVPIDRAYRLSRYRAGDSIVKPKLSCARGQAWELARRKVEQKTLELAQEVLSLYAKRETFERPPCDPQAEDKVKIFEATFPFEPTPDQIKCFEDVENDMVWRNRPMDRLVCGDVGFGKTEVALRALFRAVTNGRQAVFLAPTGVLAAQHYRTVLNRMGPATQFNVSVDLLRGGMSSRFKAGRELRERIASGESQLIVGTHALLSNNLSFKNLGLLVVDEEQRFGVKQKERLKMISNGVDVLTLSATPIPRTLQMSLSGIRDTSTIRSPPPMRKPTITFVNTFDEQTIKIAIMVELERGGQCYYVVPRISMLQEAEDMMKRLFPDVRIVVAHGRMHGNGAEESVAQFAEGKFDVLLATTVIENGVDIPTVNTIIVQNSQAFGMSTLYQLRGRVGRSDKQAYAYFFHKEHPVSEQALMRLYAINELDDLGCGFDVANRDLEIRGAGSLLGTEQSGMAAKVGFDLYMRMLKKSIRQLRALDLPLVPRTNVLLKTDGNPDTFTLPEAFIPHATTRRKEETKVRLAESTWVLVNITKMWKDTYGPLPPVVQQQLKTMHLHACTRRLGIDLVGSIRVDDEGNYDCILRSPGLRPRHIAKIVSDLPRGVLPKGIDVCFPGRFTVNNEELEVIGGRKVNTQLLVKEDTLEKDEEDWDAMDQEDVEAMQVISSAVRVKDMDEIDLEQYPRFRIPNFGPPDDNDKQVVDKLLKMLLPLAKIVYEKQESEVKQAKAAADLRERSKTIHNRRMANEALRMGYHYE